MRWYKKNKIFFVLFGFLTLWVCFHVPGIFYGTENTPLHVSYISADEQSPINGALHILKEKSLLGLKNKNTLYYGPVFSMFALPAVLTDFLIKLVTGEVTGPESYKISLIWDWGGVLILARIISVLVGFSALVAVFLIFTSKTVNKSQMKKMYSIIPAFLLATNFLFFEYSSFFRHWVFVVSFLLWQIYIVVLLQEKNENRKKLWLLQSVLTTASFGISYLSVIYQIFWLPIIVFWFLQKDFLRLKEFLGYCFVTLAGFALVVWWHPYGFIRLLGLVGVIDPIAIGPVLDLQADTEIVHSFFFYFKVFAVNTLPLVVLFLILCAFFVKKQFVFFRERWWLWAMVALPGLINYLVFSLPAHHEGRYILPSVVLFIVFVNLMFFEAFSYLDKRSVVIKAGIIFVFLSILLGTTQIMLWQRILFDGPVERQTIIPQIHAWQNENPNSKVLLLKDWPLGYVHTSEAYENYVSNFKKSGYELWNAILQVEKPKDIIPINVFYSHAQTVSEEEMETYDHVVVRIPPKVGDDIALESLMDEFDVRPWHLWSYEKYQESYSFVK